MRNLKVLPFVALVVCASVVQAQQKVVFLRPEKMLPDEFSDNDPANAWVFDLDGDKAVKVTTSHWVSCARWLDIDTLAVVSNHSLWLVRQQSGLSNMQLTPSKNVERCACSPDGNLIFYIESNPQGEKAYSLKTINRNGREAKTLCEFNCFTFPLITANEEQVFFLTQEANEAAKIISTDFNGKKGKIVFSLGSVYDESIFSLAADKMSRRIIFNHINHKKQESSIEMIDLATQKRNRVCKLDFPSSYVGCCFLGPTGIQFNSGQEPQLYYLNTSDKKITRSDLQGYDPDAY